MIGQIGLGAVGQIYAGHLLVALGSLVVYDLDSAKVRAAAKNGATPARSAKEVAAQSEIILLALPSPEAVQSAILDADGVLAGAPPGAIILDASTVDPFTCQQLYGKAKAHGVSYLDAPISGGAPMSAGTEGVKAGNITFMVGGDAEAFNRAIPVMEILGAHWLHLGPSGTGSKVKLISNLMSGLHNLVAAEALVLGAAAGISWETLLEVFRVTDAKSYQFTDQLIPRIRNNDFEPGFSIDLMYKDHRLAGELGQTLKVPLPFNSLALQFYQMFRAQGRGQKDFCAAVNFLGELANADIYHPRAPIPE